MIHFGWFVGKGTAVHGWKQPWSSLCGRDWLDPSLYIDLARALDRACFDYMIIEDGSFVPDAFQGSADWYLRNAVAVPKADPMPLVPLLGQATRGLGIVATMTTAFYPPYLAARLGATLDHLTGGRVGLNLVTAHNDRSAQNFGLPQHHEHDLRYRMADEWIEVVDQLWRSWSPDAITADPATGVFTDPGGVTPIDFEGEYFRCRGPLNMPPGPQGRPVICQAGGSAAGKAFAAQRADTVIARARGSEGARAYRDDVHATMRTASRDPASCKILFSTSIVLGETRSEAVDRKERLDAATRENLDARLAYMSFLSGIDFSKFDLDAPLPEVKTNASRALTQNLTAGTGKKTLREMATDTSSGGIDFVGTPDDVAAEMDEVIKHVGGDGFLITEALTRRTIAEIADGLAPALRRRGLLRSGYEHALFRDNLLAF
ncbi:NtaA/DmoA family FMN-dependent monooxygenase [Methylobacterium sp. J-030]|uniref:NtaA/DmoA family FMN-dependent monooxygenase n=1 Tax=Methylobacterium sp. J-030 TaxID=2836627 RepID=UPI001FBBB12F|nr:NtaA/DmoA family FMN-dependent monooxygenase [Methylobacterium sp. J-030]MCJ2069104.1 NtaA/DmoA family FMN-dependent monooxygenase [Methylobacterium sp. J-030]